MNSKTTVFSIFLCFSILVLYASCGPPEEKWGGTIEEVDAVIVVKNPKEPIHGENAFSINEELSIGEAEGEKEYMFSDIYMVAVNEAEDIYVLDITEKHVKVFDRNGKYIKTISQPGQGPGELHIPRSLQCTPQSELMVGDINRLSFFTLDGDFIKSIPTAKMRFIGAKMDLAGNMIGIDITFGKEAKYVLKKFDSELNNLCTFDSGPTPNFSREGFNPFFPAFRWAMKNDSEIVCGYPIKYEVKILDIKGNLIRKIIKDYSPLEVTQADIEESKEGHPPEILERLSPPKHFPAFRRIMADDEGRIFVCTWERTADRRGYYWDVFDQEGKYIAKIPLKSRPRLWGKSKLYSIEEDEEGYQVVKRYAINWTYNH